MRPVSFEYIYIAEYPRQAPHVLAFQLAPVAPFKHHNGNFITSVFKEIGYVEFGCHMADLAVANFLPVDPDIKTGRNAFEIEEIFFVRMNFMLKRPVI